MPSPLKRRIPGRLGRLLASLRPPSRAGPLPVQTGFPTSLADLLVKNHDRLLLTKPRRRRRPTPTTTTTTASVAAADVEQPLPSGREELEEEKVGGVAVRLRPELLGVGAAAALALMVIWSRWLVAAVTVASLSLFWIESVRSSSRRRLRPPPAAETAAELPDLRGRGVVSPIREAAAATPRPSSADDSDVGSEVSVSVSSIWTDGDEMSQLVVGGGGGDSTTNPTKRKEKRRWLRKLIAKRKEKKDSSLVSPSHGEVVGNAAAEQQQPSPSAEPTIAEASPADGRRGGALPVAALVPVVLVGLVGGKLPAVVLTVICAVFFSSEERR
uniref:Uncharacterized protein n=1 Tax=Oryza meridionalis TaxID=40149 RepID=A0A0E0FEI1_9ORYZ